MDKSYCSHLGRVGWDIEEVREENTKIYYVVFKALALVILPGVMRACLRRGIPTMKFSRLLIKPSLYSNFSPLYHVT